ncbi:MAG: sulfite exporter TauE/SafE family protein, partial [Phycisphaerales bacterium]|nr:sulfite exporter TauE/SafE family protein [Phycisphaerales bacterium]
MLRRLFSAVHSSGAVLHDLSRAQGRWEIDNARFILRRRLVLLLILVLPLLLVFPLHAYAVANYMPKDIPTIGGSKAFIPAMLEPKMFYGAIVVGLIAGLITGVIGAGGGYILTPALMSFGIHGIMAVGTDQFHLFTKAIVGTVIHRKMGNVNILLAAWFVVGSVCGVLVGSSISRAVFAHSPALSDALISGVYVLVLGSLGLYAIRDFFRLRRAGKNTRGGGGGVKNTPTPTHPPTFPFWSTLLLSPPP